MSIPYHCFEGLLLRHTPMLLAMALALCTSGCFDLNAPGESLQFEFNGGNTGEPECVQAIDCAIGSLCINGQCVEGCLSNTDCPTGELCMGNQCIAGECASSSDCTSGQQCNMTTLSCVDCLSDLDCIGNLVCSNFTCVGCTSDSECPIGTVCESETGGCVECIADLDCSPNQVCDPDLKICTRCVDDADCSDNPLQPACLRTEQGANECVGCVDDDDCPEGTCNRDLLSCEGCRSDNDCGADALQCNATSGLCYDTSCSYRDTPELLELTVQLSLSAPFMAGPLALGPLRDGDNNGVLDRSDAAALLIPLDPREPTDRSTVVLTLDNQRLWSASPTAGATLGLAVGDLDGDLRPETVALRGDRLVAHDISGSTLWTSASRTTHIPNVFDVDQDGFAEVVAGGSLFSEAGSRIWLGEAHSGTHTPTLPGIGFAANLDDDPELEIVAGGTIYSTQGELQCTEGEDGYTALADVTGDGSPELLVVDQTGSIRALDPTCERVWGPVTPGGAGPGGGLPAIADTDGDGSPEIAYVAGPDTLALLDGSGDLLWTFPLDGAHPAAGVTMADLDGNGDAEIMVSDQASLKIIRATDGFLLTEHPQGASQVPLNLPYVVDIDADGATEIVVAAGVNGELDQVVVFGDVRDRWTSARNIWNQTAYIPESIANNLTIPVVLPDWWVDGG
ncbi:MAG: FG-GAP-like repeat-containing protein, partial [Myxococcota bacterium]